MNAIVKYYADKTTLYYPNRTDTTDTAATTDASTDAAATEAPAAVETLKIGVVCPISGNSAIAGKYITHGVQVAEQELGGKITIKGVDYPVEFIYMDNEASEEKTTNPTTSLSS